MGKCQARFAYVLNENPTSLKQIEDILIKKFQTRYQQYQAIADVIVDIKNAPIEENFKTLLGALNINNSASESIK